MQTWARVLAVAELRPALGVPDEVVEAYVDAAAVLVEAEHRQAANEAPLAALALDEAATIAAHAREARR